MFGNWFRAFLAGKRGVPVWGLLLAGATAAIITGAIAWPRKKPVEWIQFHKEKGGRIVGVLVKPQRVPKSVLQTLPDTRTKAPCAEGQIKQLADRHGLFRAWEANPHLCYTAGDVGY